MCGIFGYSGSQNTADQIVIEGLKRLEYRGYDSWGVAVAAGEQLQVEKQVGKISQVADHFHFPPSYAAIAHTRWATTGSVTRINAHPHVSSDSSFALAQNGIVENFTELKTELQAKGYSFISETDTEVIVRLIEESFQTQNDFFTAFRQAFLQLKGRNTVIVLRQNGQILAARNGSPLVVGVDTKTNDVFVSSDTLSFAGQVDKMLVIENGQMITLSPQRHELALFSAQNGKAIKYELEDLTISSNRIDREGYAHFMLKEIHETPAVIRQIVHQADQPLAELVKAIRDAKQVFVVGSGTAGFAAYQIAFYLRVFGGVPAISLVGAEATSYFPLFSKGDVIIAPSQSGETADVLEVLEYAKLKGLKIASLVNMPGSMITRLSDYPFMSLAGPEICVMSTKVFSSQIAWGYLLAKAVQGQLPQAKKQLDKTAQAIQTYLEAPKNTNQIKKVAHHLAPKKDIFLLGKYQNLAILNEGMVKIVEGAYKHAHAIPAGDLKHYAITLMEKGMPVIVAVSEDETKNDVLSAINEVRLRGAEVIAIAHQKESNYDFFIETPDLQESDALANLIPLQLLAYYLALELGNDIDKPRHIAKSVTVK